MELNRKRRDFMRNAGSGRRRGVHPRDDVCRQGRRGRTRTRTAPAARPGHGDGDGGRRRGRTAADAGETHHHGLHAAALLRRAGRRHPAEQPHAAKRQPGPRGRLPGEDRSGLRPARHRPPDQARRPRPLGFEPAGRATWTRRSSGPSSTTSRCVFFPDPDYDYEYPEMYVRIFGEDYVPDEYQKAHHDYAKSHRWYPTARIITVNDVYGWDEDAQVDYEPIFELVAKHFRNPAGRPRLRQQPQRALLALDHLAESTALRFHPPVSPTFVARASRRRAGGAHGRKDAALQAWFTPCRSCLREYVPPPRAHRRPQRKVG